MSMKITPFTRHHVILLITLAVTLGAVVDSPAEAAANPSDFDRSKARAPTPLIAASLPAPQRFALIAAFKTAYRRAYESESCRRLFEELEISAAGALAASHYDRPAAAAIRAHCQKRVGAVTSVRSRHIHLCPGFETLSRNDQAAILIHEALHTAGLGEWPQDLEAPTSRQITERVKLACSL